MKNSAEYCYETVLRLASPHSDYFQQDYETRICIMEQLMAEAMGMVEND